MAAIQGSFAGMNTVRNISLIQRSISKTMHRVPPAKDENDVVVEAPEMPNEVAISQQMRSQIGSLTDSIRNLEIKLGRNEAANGAIGELVEKAKELREVAIEASQEATINPERGKAYQNTFDALTGEYNEIVAQASFAGKKLLDGSKDAAANVRPMAQLDVSTADVARDAIKDIDSALRALHDASVASETRTRYDYEATVRRFEVASQNLSAASSQVRDPQSAAEQAEYLKTLVRENANLASSAQGHMTSDKVFKLLHA